MGSLEVCLDVGVDGKTNLTRLVRCLSFSFPCPPATDSRVLPPLFESVSVLDCPTKVQRALNGSLFRGLFRSRSTTMTSMNPSPAFPSTASTSGTGKSVVHDKEASNAASVAKRYAPSLPARFFSFNLPSLSTRLTRHSPQLAASCASQASVGAHVAHDVSTRSRHLGVPRIRFRLDVLGWKVGRRRGALYCSLTSLSLACRG